MACLAAPPCTASTASVPSSVPAVGRAVTRCTVSTAADWLTIGDRSCVTSSGEAGTCGETGVAVVPTRMMVGGLATPSATQVMDQTSDWLN